MKVLFVCSANKHRSRTADDYFTVKYPKHDFMSAGTNHYTCRKEGTTPLEEDHMAWADVVYVMENDHKKMIGKHVGSKYNKKIVVLNIPDYYLYYQNELIDILEEKLKDAFN